MKFELPFEQILQELQELRAEVQTLKQGHGVEYMTRDKFCKEFKISITSCRTYESKNILTPKKMEGKIFYKIAQINNYLNNQ